MANKLHSRQRIYFRKISKYSKERSSNRVIYLFPTSIHACLHAMSAATPTAALRDKCLAIIQNDIPPNITHTPCACQITRTIAYACASLTLLKHATLCCKWQARLRTNTHTQTHAHTCKLPAQHAQLNQFKIHLSSQVLDTFILHYFNYPLPICHPVWQTDRGTAGQWDWEAHCGLCYVVCMSAHV